jgi:hypothetical protein
MHDVKTARDITAETMMDEAEVVIARGWPREESGA